MTLLLIVFFVVKIFGLTKTGKNGQYRDRADSLEILKMRYVKGEIDQAEYFKMKSILFKA